MDHPNQRLMHHLMKLGVDAPLIPGFIRSLANALLINPSMSPVQANRRLKYLGWEEIELDYHTLELAISAFEDHGMPRLVYKSAPWYLKRFNPSPQPKKSA